MAAVLSAQRLLAFEPAAIFLFGLLLLHGLAFC